MSKIPTTPRRHRDVPDLALRLDHAAGDQARQVHAGLRAAILDGRFEPGARLPSSRDLARQIGVARNAVIIAYEGLQGDGLLEARTGSGTYVADRLPRTPAAASAVPPATRRTPIKPFALGHTFADPILLRSLAAALKRNILSSDGTALGYGDPRGSEALRRQIAIHLSASRGVRCDPGCIVVVSGVHQGLRLCADALLERGDAVWFEEPGYPAARKALQAAGMRTVPIAVDPDGLDIGAGGGTGIAARAVYVTPSNQFPTGATMAIERRLALVEWARANDAWIFEDDYDNEFRYEGPSLTALAGIGGDRVIYFGTFSKTVFAGLRLSYLAVPPDAIERVTAARAVYDRCSSVMAEVAIAELMADGSIQAHTRRMRKRYRAARDALGSTLAEAAGDALRIVVPRQGLHVVAHLPKGLSPDAGPRIRLMAGVESWLISEMRTLPGGADGFVLGFAGHEEARIVEAAGELGRATLAYLHESRKDAPTVRPRLGD